MKKLLSIIVLGLLLSFNANADLINEIKELNILFKDGYLTKDEFSKAKKILIDTGEKVLEKNIIVAFCSSAINYDYGISSISIGKKHNCYSDPISYPEYKSRRSNFNEENLCINKELNLAEYTATLNCEEKSLAMKSPFYKISFVEEMSNKRYIFSVEIKNKKL
tara:strand:- start:189 stop:680 length:492 start_codon:yes stop_codon:yes gene_type:complete